MNRLRDGVMPFLIVVTAVFAITMGVLAVTNVFFPGLSAQAGLSYDTIGATLAGQAETVTHLTGLSPLTDLLLFAAAYILVCILLWVQSELRTYLSNRSHFR